MEKILLIIGYSLVVVIVLILSVRRYGEKKIAAPEFDSFYFLKFAAIAATCSQFGFVILVSVLYHAQHSVAVGLTALIGIPGWLLVMLAIMRGFTVRYNSLGNLIRRLDRMNPDQQEQLLASLPPEVFMRLPGDYRYVSHSQPHQ